MAWRDFQTSFGVIPLWVREGGIAESRPVVLAIAGPFGGADEIAKLASPVSVFADIFIMRFPGAGAPLLAQNSVEAISQAVSEVVAQSFGDRPVLVFGVSSGAAVALGVKAPNLRRIVAAEPILTAEGLRPIVEQVRQGLRPRPDDAPIRTLACEVLGIAEGRTEERNHLAAIDALEVPVDVLLGDQMASPQPSGRTPSLVDAAARARLAANPHVRLHRARGAGHEVQVEAEKQLREVLLEACRRASVPPVHDTGVDEVLVEATPLTARRVLHWGPGGRAFASAYLAWNPTASVEVLGEDPQADVPDPGGAGFDALALGAPPPSELFDRLAAVLNPGGCLTARWVSGIDPSAVVREALAVRSLALREPVDDAGAGVLRAQKMGPGERPRPALHLDFVAFASLLMDVRTRLPARGMRSDPELAATYDVAPADLPVSSRDTPKILVVQRPAERGLDSWIQLIAPAIARGRVVVLEFDDHPTLIAEVLGRTLEPDEMNRFRYVHAVQTSTPALVEAFRAHNPEVRMFPNAVFELAPFPKGERPRRVFYGAVLRGGFGSQIVRSLAPAIAQFPDTEFVVVGDRLVFDALPTNAKRYYDYLTYEAYLALMAECSISLSPIEALPLRDTKSDAKFLDASRAGVLTIASPTIYDRVIRHGENGLLAPRIEDWAPLLSKALGDPDLQRTLSRRAWEYVRNERMFAHQIVERREWYRDLWERRDELTAALMDRMPGLREAVAALT